MIDKFKKIIFNLIFFFFFIIEYLLKSLLLLSVLIILFYNKYKKWIRWQTKGSTPLSNYGNTNDFYYYNITIIAFY